MGLASPPRAAAGHYELPSARGLKTAGRAGLAPRRQPRVSPLAPGARIIRHGNSRPV